MAMGSVLGTVKDVVDERRLSGERVGVVGVTTFRPFPAEAVRRALSGARRVVVVEKAFRVGGGGVLSGDVLRAVHDARTTVHTVVAGLGGRPITRRSIDSVLASAARGDLGTLTFLDLDAAVVERERARVVSSSPHATGTASAATVRRRPPPAAAPVGGAP